MDGRPNRREKKTFSNLSGLAWTGPKAPSTLIRINLKTHLFNGRKRSPRWRNLKTPARWCSVDGRKRSFSKTLTSSGHVISVTVPFRPIPVDAFHCFGGLIIHSYVQQQFHLIILVVWIAFYVGLLLLSTRFGHFLAQIVCFPQKNDNAGRRQSRTSLNKRFNYKYNSSARAL